MASLVLLLVGLRRRKGHTYPPGPPQLPVIGNLFDLPTETPWIKYTEWAQQYGDIVSLNVGGTVIVVVNSVQAADDLLDKRGAKYIDRPPVPFFLVGEVHSSILMNWSFFVLIAPYTDGWRARRKHCVRGLRPRAVQQYQGTLTDKVRHFLKDVRAQPDAQAFRTHVEELQGAIIMSIVYGYDVSGPEDTYLTVARDANAIGQRHFSPGDTLVNALPFLAQLPEWLPGMGFHAVARIGARLGAKMVKDPYLLVKSRMEQGFARPSLTRDCLEELEQSGLAGDEEAETAIMESSGSLYLAGADTTLSTLTTMFAVLALHPGVQEKAQAELDAVVGRSRLPDFGDRPRLPYINAMCRELVRWRPVAPMSVPHAPLEDDVYNGYLIPKGAVVLTNIWAMMHDPAVYPDPDAYRPERFLFTDGKFKDDPRLAFAFGFGRRSCPANHLVDATLFIFVASLLSAFSVRKAKDAQGREIPVDGTHGGRVLSHPKDFKCLIVPRDADAEKLLKDIPDRS
ncbi:cytochrome P450 [Auriscalpium vulgare]|uniref:Cytochrome P450 n=1 Tax=Auriscalpium vulgare TaxID=40419 RepID=A0ACB8RP83_9AGAM|nr:cytochrome P450 [Auriscalpium vulgare]